MIIGAYILTTINYILYCSSRFCKKKSAMLLLDIIAKIITSLSFVLLSSYTGSGLMAFAIVTLLLIYLKEQRGFPKWLSDSLFGVCLIVYVLIFVKTYDGFTSILIFVSSALCLLSNWYLPPQKMRLMGFPISLMYLWYQLALKNYVALLEVFVIVSNLVAFIKYNRLKPIES